MQDGLLSITVIIISFFLLFKLILFSFRYHDNLLRMEDTHPGITSMFENGAISVRRTKKNFSGSAIDLTLEQTQNADSASASGI